MAGFSLLATGAGWAATVQLGIGDYEFGIASLLNNKKLLQEGNGREVDNTHIQLADDVDISWSTMLLSSVGPPPGNQPSTRPI